MSARLAAAVRDAGGLLVAAPLWVWWAVDRGGYPSPMWMAGLVALAIATAITLVVGPLAPLRGARAVAVAALAAYVAASALSMLVASDRGQAWLSSERALLYALAFALPVLWPPSLRALKTGVVVWVGATLAALVIGLAHARDGVAIDGRLTDPTAYPNATGALLLMGALPALILACAPRSSTPQRGAGLAAAGALAAGALLTQSRGILVVGAFVAAGAILLSPARWRLAAGAAGVFAAVAWQRHGLLGLRHMVTAGTPADGVAGATTAILAIAAALAIAGIASSAARRSVALPRIAPRWSRALRRVGLAAGVAAVFAIAVGATGGRPGAWASDRFQDFRTPDYQRVESGGSRFGGGLGSNRFDYWRVAATSAARHPLSGTGAGSFAESYFVTRRTSRAPAYAHELWLGTAAEIGLPGLAALLAFAVAAAIALRRSVRERAPADAGLLLAAGAPLAVLLVHSSGDWTFAFPGLAVPALGLAAGAIAAQPSAGSVRGARRRRRTPAAVAIVALAATAVPLACAEQLVQRGEARARLSPGAARADLRRAMRWAPLSGRPALVLALLELRHDASAARSAFAEAHARDPDGWFALLELAVLAPRDRRGQALGLVRRSLARNPRDPLIAEVARALAHGERPAAARIASRALGTPG